ncbi:MAG: hypothetical protein ACRC2T_07495, partial [Thermoguttaceae bacterium]
SLSRCGMLGGVSATKLWRCVKKNVGPIIRAIMSKSVKELAMSLCELTKKLGEIRPQKRRKKRPATREMLRNTPQTP